MHTLSAEQGRALLALARQAIAIEQGLPGDGVTADAPWLRAPGATFVTLTQHGRLRGCIGSLQAYRPLWLDVQANAVAAAMHDPRFPPLPAHEFDGTGIEVSLLSPAQTLAFDSEADALAQLRPGVDGVVLEYGRHRSTFLPQVWAQLPDADEFMAQLKRKAGLPPHFWAPGLRLARYTVEKWIETDLPAHAPAGGGRA